MQPRTRYRLKQAYESISTNVWKIIMASSLPERLLVRDCLHCCQGGQGGRFVSWFDTEGRYDVVGAGDTDDASVDKVSVPQRQLIWKITEVGRLVRRLNGVVAGEASGELSGEASGEASGERMDGELPASTATPVSTPSSVVHEAIKSAIRKELRSCYRVIAVLEGQATAPDPKHVLTLRRTQVWLEEVKQRLEIVARCVDATMGVHGGEALNVLYSMSRHGDTFVVDTIAPLLNAACAPYFMQLEQWLTQGVIGSSSNASNYMNSASCVYASQAKGAFMVEKLRTPRDLPYDDWKEGFAIDPAAQPKVFDEGLARDVLNVGKAVYFLRRYCDDEMEWNEALGKLEHLGQLTQIGAQFSASQRLVILKRLVHEAKLVMDETLLRVIKDKENIFGHLENIKRYVLLSKGDFVRVFIDLADEELNGVQDASEFSEYSLQGCVEKALVDTNAADVSIEATEARARRNLLDCIQVQRLGHEMLSGMASAADKKAGASAASASAVDGWTMFGLGYVLEREDTPAAVVLDTASMKQYADISSILWSMKRAEHISSLSWHRLEAAARELNRLRTLERERGVDRQTIAGNAPMLLRYLHSLRTGVAQFVSTLQSHIVYRVIEPAWKAMNAELVSATDLDGLIRAHAEGLRSIARGTFTERKKSRTGETKATLKAALCAAMDVYVPIEKLCLLVERCVAEFAEFAARARQSERLGTWTEEEAGMAPQPISDETLDDIKRTAIRIRGVFARYGPNDLLAQCVDRDRSHSTLDAPTPTGTVTSFLHRSRLQLGIISVVLESSLLRCGKRQCL